MAFISFLGCIFIHAFYQQQLNELNDSNIESAVVKYADKSKEELLIMQIRDKIFSCYTTSDNVFRLGMAGY